MNVRRKYISHTNKSRYISFADEGTKALCISAYDTTKNNKLSHIEADKVTSIGTTFKGKTTLGSFNELSQFHNVTEIPAEAFNGCTALTLDGIPSNITSVGDRAFTGCTSLGELKSDSNKIYAHGAYQSEIKSIPKGANIVGGAFEGNKSVTYVDVNNPTRLGIYAFDSSSIVTIDNLEGITNIPVRCFCFCSGLKSFQVPSGVTDIASLAFYQCTALTTFASALSVKSIGAGAFNQCHALSSVTLNEGLEYIGEFAFNNCWKLTYLELPSSVTKTSANIASTQAKCNVKILNTTSVLQVESSSQTEEGQFCDGTIYVPNTLLDAYASDSFWKYYYDAGRLKGYDTSVTEYEVTDSNGDTLADSNGDILTVKL